MQELLMLCARIERAVSDLYFLFQEIFADHPQSALLWQKTAQEELNHEQQFLMAARLYAGQLAPDASVDLERLQKVLQGVLTVIERSKTSRPSIEQALRLAINLEEQLVETHLKAVLRFNDESVNRLFKAMMAADQEHVEALKKGSDSSAATGNGTP